MDILPNPDEANPKSTATTLSPSADPELSTVTVLYLAAAYCDMTYLRETLQASGFSVRFCIGDVALSPQVLAPPLDAVIIEHEPPAHDGFELLRVLKATYRSMPVVILSSHNEAALAVAFMKQGAEDYLVRRSDGPDALELTRALEGAIRQNAMAQLENATTLAIYKQSALLTSLINTIPHYVFWKDAQSVYRGCNINFSQSARLSSPEELVGKTDHDLYWSEWAHLFQEQDQIVLGGTPIRNREILWRTGDGHYVTYLSNTVPLTEADGSIVGLVSIFVDISEHKNLEESLARRGRELEQMNRELAQKNQEILHVQEQLIQREKMASLGSMAAGIAHEIRNPLNFIQNLSLINAEHCEEIQSELSHHAHKLGTGWSLVCDQLEMVRENALLVTNHGERAGRIITNMMALASEGTELLVETDIDKLLRDTLHFFIRSQKRASDVAIVQESNPLYGSFPVLPQELNRALLCVLTNALESVLHKRELMDDFEPRIEVRLADDFFNCTIVIRDNGLGLTPETKEKMFLPFFTTRQAIGGNPGLGLAICYDLIVKKHLGKIEVDTVLGEFAEFKIIIPKPNHTSL